jgi:hypothetical protein
MSKSLADRVRGIGLNLESGEIILWNARGRPLTGTKVMLIVVGVLIATLVLIEGLLENVWLDVLSVGPLITIFAIILYYAWFLKDLGLNYYVTNQRVVWTQRILGLQRARDIPIQDLARIEPGRVGKSLGIRFTSMKGRSILFTHLKEDPFKIKEIVLSQSKQI